MEQSTGEHKVGKSLASVRTEIRLVWLERGELRGEEHSAVGEDRTI